jgi:hypothetical protein
MVGEIDVTEQILAKYDEVPGNALRRSPSEPPLNLHPQAAEMFIWMAQHAVHQIGRSTETYLDYTVPVTGLALSHCLVACERSRVAPDFSRPQRPDPWVKDEFRKTLITEVNLEQAARLKYGIWRCCYESSADIFHYRLTRRRRVSALMLLNSRAQAALLQQLIGRSLSDLSPDDLYHAFAASPEMLHFLTHSDSGGWAKFESAMGIDAQQLAAVAGFMVFLSFAADVARHSYWYDESFLLRLWGLYAEAFPQYGSTLGESVVQAICAFCMTPEEAATSIMHPPFYKLHGRLLRNPTFTGAHNLTASLLTIAIRRHERAWSNTLGSSLAHAADTLASLLPSVDRLHVIRRRNYSGGDIDLALYDSVSQELLLCEVKTVYDKHRTDSLMNRFEEAKVNVDRAVSQLNSTEDAIRSGQLTLKSLFGRNDAPPVIIHKSLLTWVDPIDVTMGTDNEEVLSLNFAMFLSLCHASGGDVKAMVRSAHELRNLWAIASTRALDLGQPSLSADVEVQTGLFDTRESLAKLPLSPLTRKIIAEMETIDSMKTKDDATKYISYMYDSVKVLGQLTGNAA